MNNLFFSEFEIDDDPSYNENGSYHGGYYCKSREDNILIILWKVKSLEI